MREGQASDTGDLGSRGSGVTCRRRSPLCFRGWAACLPEQRLGRQSYHRPSPLRTSSPSEPRSRDGGTSCPHSPPPPSCPRCLRASPGEGAARGKSFTRRRRRMANLTFASPRDLMRARDRTMISHRIFRLRRIPRTGAACQRQALERKSPLSTGKAVKESHVCIIISALDWREGSRLMMVADSRADRAGSTALKLFTSNVILVSIAHRPSGL
jgi:hypothetical protein